MLDLTGSLILLGIFVTSVYALKWIHLFRRKHYPPGPWGFPVVGHLPFFGSHPPATFLKWQRMYGNVFRIRMGSWKTVVINDYSSIKDALDRQDDAFSSRPRFLTMETLKKAIGNTETIAFGPFNHSYLHTRKLVANALNKITNSKSTLDTQDLILDEGNILVDKFLSWKGEPHLLEDEIHLCIETIIDQILFGRDQKVIDDRPSQVRAAESNEFVRFSGSGNPMDVMPWLKYIMPWRATELHRILTKFADIRYEHAMNHKKTFDKKHLRNDLTDIFLSFDLPEEAENEEVTVTRSHLIRNLNVLAGAGQESTSAALYWLLVYMVAFPEVQKNVQNELDEIVGCGRNVDLNDRSKLYYTEATILETHRITSSVPFSVPHYTIKDTKLNGYDIDKNTVVLTNLHAVHMDKDFWQDPDEFRPARFLISSTEMDADKCNHVIPFGLGRRRCLGEKLAKLEVFLLFSNLMHRCSFIKADTGPVDLTQKRGLVYKAKPMKITVHSR